MGICTPSISSQGAETCNWDAVKSLREAGHAALADRIETQLVGHNVIHGRWTFQIVEEYDDGYWSLFRELERRHASRSPMDSGTSWKRR